MKKYLLASAVVTGLLTLTGTSALAQDRGQGRSDQNRGANYKFDDHARQSTTDWYNQHKDNPPAGFREQDRLTADQESRIHEGAVLDPDLRGRMHPAPSDLRHRLPPPPAGHRYVTLGFHVGLVDRHNQVKDVIHVHDR